MNLRAIGRDPAVWQVLVKFRPQKFLEEDVEINGQDFLFPPLGAGRCKCPASAAQLGMYLVTPMWVCFCIISGGLFLKL